MNFLSMKYFSYVAKERSFTKAASKLHITQQTLSTHIGTIEKELGCRLFIRTSPLELTYAGRVFYNYAKQYEKLRISMEHEFFDINSEKKGVLRIGIAHTRGRIIMPELIGSYKEKYSKMEIQIIETANDNLCRQLLDNELDLIIASFSDDIPEIEVQPFYSEKIVLLVPIILLQNIYSDKAEEIIQIIQETQNISALSQCPFLLSNQEDIAGKIGERIISDAIFTPNISVQSGNIETLLELCAQGAGACFCPDIFVHRILSYDKLSKVQMFHFDNIGGYQIKFGWLKKPYLWNAIVDFIEIASLQKQKFLR
ncbi:LysR family transcriptional regulator [Clostridium malenominatum]|uniref:LysR family transcriptional regulator n=1 Tax=Clostridium malenominatum TaxID=1539 RepID=A0ABN1ILR4_9CLOT